MINFFPNPYPDEWFYSILCRYHVRSGNHGAQATKEELVGIQENFYMGSLFPNRLVYVIISQLPNNLFKIKDIILNHTLFLYYTRVYSGEAKTEMLEKLCSGHSVSLSHLWRAWDVSTWRIRYCPQCLKDDLEHYGENYWHRIHQIPIMSHCHIHNDRQLQEVSTVDFNYIKNQFCPLSPAISGVPVAHSVPSTMGKIIVDYATLPLKYSPSKDYSNLATVLMNMGYGELRYDDSITLDAPRLKEEMSKKYGAQLVNLVIGKNWVVTNLNRICKWNISAPEKYILLQDFSKLSTKRMLGSKIEDIHLRSRMQSLSESETIYEKAEAAQLLGLTVYQMEKMAKRFGIVPFWNRERERADFVVKVSLTRAEQMKIRQLQKQKGFRYESVFLKHCILSYLGKEMEDKT